MSALPSTDRLELSPSVRAILEADGPQSELLKHFVRYLEALIAPDPSGLDNAVTADVRCHELEALGVPPGREGLKMFRREINGGIPDEHIFIAAVSFDGSDIIEADLKMTATQTGELMGIPATGRKLHFEVYERSRFVAGRLAERWARVDIEGIKRKLTGPIEGSS